MLHALGIYHEQQREDRHYYVWLSGDVFHDVDYEKHKTDQRGLPYDFGSVMHYHTDENLIPRDIAYQQSAKREGGLSFKDAKLINLVYCKCK